MGAELLWTIISAIAGILAILGPFVIWGVNSLRNQLKRQFDPIIEQNNKLIEENEKLRKELELRIKLPSFGLDAVKLTEIAAERKIEEITNRYDKALQDKDQELAYTLQSQLEEIHRLQNELSGISINKEKIQAELVTAISRRQPDIRRAAIGLPTGLIMLIRFQGKYGAIQMVDQASSERGSTWRYIWWYQPDSSGIFINQNAQTGYTESKIRQGAVAPLIEIGPIRLMWSEYTNGIGWVYFGPTVTPSDEYEMCVTNEIDISGVNAERYADLFLQSSKITRT